MDPIFEHPFFDSAKEKMKCAMEEPRMVGLGPRIRLDLQTKEHLYSTNKWITALSQSIDSLKIIISYMNQYIKSTRMFISYI